VVRLTFHFQNSRGNLANPTDESVFIYNSALSAIVSAAPLIKFGSSDGLFYYDFDISTLPDGLYMVFVAFTMESIVTAYTTVVSLRTILGVQHVYQSGAVVRNGVPFKVPVLVLNDDYLPVESIDIWGRLYDDDGVLVDGNILDLTKRVPCFDGCYYAEIPALPVGLYHARFVSEGPEIESQSHLDITISQAFPAPVLGNLVAQTPIDYGQECQLSVLVTEPGGTLPDAVWVILANGGLSSEPMLLESGGGDIETGVTYFATAPGDWLPKEGVWSGVAYAAFDGASIKASPALTYVTVNVPPTILDWFVSELRARLTLFDTDAIYMGGPPRVEKPTISAYTLDATGDPADTRHTSHMARTSVTVDIKLPFEGLDEIDQFPEDKFKAYDLDLMAATNALKNIHAMNVRAVVWRGYVPKLGMLDHTVIHSHQFDIYHKVQA